MPVDKDLRDLLETIEARIIDAVLSTSKPAPARQSSPAATGPGVVKFGRDKGKRYEDVDDLTWYRAAIAKSVDDPSKERWREANLADLAEIDRAMGGGGASGPDLFGDNATDDDPLPF